MIVAVDVDYRSDAVVAAAVGFAEWTDAHALVEVSVTSDAPPAEYEPGQFYLRELPHVHAVLAGLDARPHVIVVDGFVWLGPDRRGLGAHLHQALGEAIAVVGVAKNPFTGAQAIEVVRGSSAKPLFVTAAGIDAREAAEHVRHMHGEHRIPTLLRRVDQLCRV